MLRPRTLAVLCSTAVVAACDSRPPAARPPRRDAAPPTPAPFSAGAAGRAASLPRAADRPCPAAEFPAFVAAFADDTAVQAGFTRFPLEDVTYAYGVDAQGRDDTAAEVRLAGRADVPWPLMPPAARRRADSLEIRVDTAGGRPRAVVYKPDTDYQIAYVFARAAVCWQLVRREDQSL